MSFRNIANSTGSLELQGLEQTAFPECTKHPTPATVQKIQPEEKGQNKRKGKKTDSTAPKRSKKNDTQRKDRSPDDCAGANNVRSPLPAPPRISLRDLMEAETKIVFGDEQDITHKSLASTATQLMCQAAEIGGPPSGPNLSFLPSNWQMARCSFTGRQLVLPTEEICHCSQPFHCCTRGTWYSNYTTGYPSYRPLSVHLIHLHTRLFENVRAHALLWGS